jgi:hypothetical protein
MIVSLAMFRFSDLEPELLIYALCPPLQSAGI